MEFCLWRILCLQSSLLFLPGHERADKEGEVIPAVQKFPRPRAEPVSVQSLILKFHFDLGLQNLWS